MIYRNIKCIQMFCKKIKKTKQKTQTKKKIYQNDKQNKLTNR